MATAPHIVENLKQLLAHADDRFGGRGGSSAASGISVELLSALDRGSVDGWTTTLAESLARAVGVDPAAVWDEQPLAPPLSLSFLRKGTWGDFHPDDAVLFSRVLERAESLRALRRILGMGPNVRAAFAPAPPAAQHFKDGYRKARLVRDELALGNEPLPNLHKLVPERFDIEIAHLHLQTARLSAAALSRGDAAAIVLNDRVEDRLINQRRSIAHELCHLLFDPAPSRLLAVLEGTEDKEPEEVRARAFAAELLVPEGGLLEVNGLPEKVRDLHEAERIGRRTAAHFAAPTELAANHLVNHGFVHEVLRQELIAMLRGAAIRHPERRTDAVAARLRQAVDEQLVTTGRARELQLSM